LAIGSEKTSFFSSKKYFLYPKNACLKQQLPKRILALASEGNPKSLLFLLVLKFVENASATFGLVQHLSVTARLVADFRSYLFAAVFILL